MHSSSLSGTCEITSTTMARTPLVRAKPIEPQAIEPVRPHHTRILSRASIDEILDRRRTVRRMRMRGLSYREIAKKLGVGPMTIKRDLDAIRAEHKARLSALDREEYVGEALSVYEEMELRAWQDYESLSEGDKDREKFMRIIKEARADQNKLLMDLGVLVRAPTESVIRVSNEAIMGWSPEAQDLVALALLKSKMRPLAEPEPERLIEGHVEEPEEAIASHDDPDPSQPQ